MRPLVVMSCGVSDDGGAFQGRLSYVQAVAAAGGSVLVAPPLQELPALERLAEQADCILLPGGGDLDPLQYGEEAVLENGRVEPGVDVVDLFLARHALAAGKPVLAICRGCQVLNVAAGGTLIQDLPSQGRTRLQHYQRAPRWHASHHITIEPGSKLASILEAEALLVNSFHHQAVRTPGQGFAIVARTADDVPEAIESTGHPFALGVQWHPEGMVDHHPLQRRLFGALIAACGRTGEERHTGPAVYKGA